MSYKSLLTVRLFSNFLIILKGYLANQHSRNFEKVVRIDKHGEVFFLEKLSKEIIF